jgi:hypothetical protein
MPWVSLPHSGLLPHDSDFYFHFPFSDFRPFTFQCFLVETTT